MWTFVRCGQHILVIFKHIFIEKLDVTNWRCFHFSESVQILTMNEQIESHQVQT